MAVENRMHRRDRRPVNVRIQPGQPFAYLWRTPGRLVLLEAHNQLLDLKRKLIGVAVGSA
ncbi:hypothetical protein X761_20205 [Mesorhizobium sp. LSHC424B00]|nr:hypothetical protein X761_20205 [Mesorhizobium sp. LSHC424B00]